MKFINKEYMMANNPWFNWTFWKPKAKQEENADEALLKLHECILTEPTTLDNQYKLMTIRGIMICYEDGSFTPDMHIPEGLLFDIRRRMQRVGVFVEGGWYDADWVFDSTVDFINNDYREMEEIYIPDTVNAFKRAIDHARINGHTEIVIYGTPHLINILLPFIDVLEIFSNGLAPYKPKGTSPFAKLAITNAEVLKRFILGSSDFVVTKNFVTPSYKYFKLINNNPTEIKRND